jgi:hypothetical protein
MAEIPPMTPPYDPPRIGQVLTPDDLEREALDAGVTDGVISVPR